MGDFHDIRAFVHSVRRRLALQSALEGAAFLAVVLLGVAACAVLAASFADGSHLPYVRIAALFAVALVLGWALIRYALMPWRRLRRDEAVARHVERRVPSLLGSVLSCVELEPRVVDIQGTGQFSVGLVYALAQDTAAAVRRIHAQDLVSWTGTRRLAETLALGAAVLVLAVLLVPDPFRDGARALLFADLGPQATELSTRALERDVVVGDITYTLVYPAYTRLPTRIVKNSAGDLTALVGTKVSVVTQSLVPAASARLVFEGESVEPLALTAGKDGGLSGELTVKREARFSFEVTQPDGTIVSERARHSLETEADNPPSVELLHPAKDVEVQSDDPVKLYFSSADDFGLAGVDVVTQKLEEDVPPVRRRVAGLAGGERTHVGESQVDVKELALQPGDTVECWLEAQDNNTVAETPQRTQSRKVRIKLHSPEEKHKEIVEAERELFDRMVDLLGDRLESPIDEQKQERYDAYVNGQTLIVARTGQLLTDFHQLLLTLTLDPLATDAVRADLEELVRRHDELFKNESHHTKVSMGEERASERATNLQILWRDNETTITQLEQDIPLLEQIIDQQHQQELVDRAKDVVAAQRELQELLDRLKKTNDPALKMQIQQKISRLMKQLEELMAEMQKNAKPMPYENFNMDALEAGPQQKELSSMKSQLQKMQELLQQGKIDEAMALSNELGRDVQTLMSELEGDLQDMRAAGNQRGQTEMRKVQGDLSKVINKQDAVNRDTSDIEKSLAEKTSQLVRDQLAPQIAEQLESLRQLERALGKVAAEDLHPDDAQRLDQLQQGARDLRETLSQEDLSQALKMAKKLQQELSDLQSEVQLGLDRMAEREGDTHRVRKRRKASQRLEGERPRIADVVRNLEKMVPRPDELLDPGEQRQLDRLAERQKRTQEAIESLRDQIQKLEQESPGVGARLDRELEAANKEFGEAQNRLEGHQPGRAESKQKDGMEHLENARKSLDQAMGKPRPGQEAPGVDRSQQKVAIPDADRYSVPKEFRDELLKAIKEQAPGTYKRLIERYYEALIQ